MSVLVVVPHPEQVPFSRVDGCAGALDFVVSIETYSLWAVVREVGASPGLLYVYPYCLKSGLPCLQLNPAFFN